MKAISITTIVCGTALILAPIVHDMFLTSMIARLLETTREHASITSTLSPSYNPWCMFIGVCGIVSGVVLAVRFRGESEIHRVAPPLSHVAPSNA
jgi:hypothetical protein